MPNKKSYATPDNEDKFTYREGDLIIEPPTRYRLIRTRRPPERLLASPGGEKRLETVLMAVRSLSGRLVRKREDGYARRGSPPCDSMP
jgi:hypothetical protein